MEDQLGQYWKFGFCKFKDDCKKIHVKAECKDLSNCQQIKSCRKIHLKQCKLFKSGDSCRFKKGCAYNHQESKSDEKQDGLQEKVSNLERKVLEMTNKVASIESKQIEQLEKVVKAMCRKVLGLEGEIMQNTVLSFTERSGHCGATISDHSSWHPLATSEGDIVISYIVWQPGKLRP